MRNILGIDPGSTTGLVMLADGAVAYSEQISFTDVGEKVEILIATADGIGIEQYIITPSTAKKTRQYDALYTIGIVIFLSRRMGVPMRLQKAADAKNAYTNEHLHQLGLFDSVTGPHARDALRHALLANRMMTNL